MIAVVFYCKKWINNEKIYRPYFSPNGYFGLNRL